MLGKSSLKSLISSHINRHDNIRIEKDSRSTPYTRLIEWKDYVNDMARSTAFIGPLPIPAKKKTLRQSYQRSNKELVLRSPS